MSRLRHRLTIYVPNTLIGGSTITELDSGPIAEPNITYIIQQYPFSWMHYLDLNDTDIRRRG